MEVLGLPACCHSGSSVPSGQGRVARFLSLAGRSISLSQVSKQEETLTASLLAEPEQHGKLGFCTTVLT